MALLETGFPNDLKNARRWEALDEAVALRDFELTRILLEQSHKAVKSLIKSKKGDLLQTLRSIDDVSFKVGCPCNVCTCLAASSSVLAWNVIAVEDSSSTASFYSGAEWLTLKHPGLSAQASDQCVTHSAYGWLRNHSNC